MVHPEQEVGGNRQRLEPLQAEQLEHHPGRGHRPDEHQQTHAPGAADRDRRDGAQVPAIITKIAA